MTTSDTAAPVDETRGSFRADVSPRGISDAFRQYFARLRSGDPGGLPSVLGLLVLGLIFATTTKDFLSHNNAANLAAQSSFIALLALGLVFVLLVGEIDLSAGTTAGMCSAFAAQGLKSNDLHAAVGNYVYWGLAAGMAGAIVLGVMNRMIVAPAIVAIGLIVMLTGANEDHQWLAFYFAISIGAAVGTFSGTLVTRLGIPSFIVTLALLLAWEGVELYALKNQ
jgi:D-xylose transport system permease protein